MPIRLPGAPEPLSGMSYLEPVELIESDASRLLYQEMLSYCRGRINGRSFLIAGHRGAGKTTMVAGAYLKTRKKAEIDRLTMRPLLVQLNGTTLLPSVKEGEARELQPGTRPWYESVGQPGAVAQMEAQEALIQITLCLFRALAREVAREFRRKAVVHPVGGRSLSRSRLRDRLELAAQLEVELSECPDPLRLRFFWERAGLLGATPLSLFSAPFWRKRTGSELDEAGQGLRELVAISGAAEAFRRISGTLKQQDTATQRAEDKRESSQGVDTSGKGFLDALAALLSGALVGAGIHAGSWGAVPSTLAGIGTALAAVAVFRYQHTRSRARARSREYSFLFDTSVTTLDRALPILIERLHEAGVAPVFVVDELDKVESLNRRMGGMVRYLKMLVADQAFFCFLTDRTYYEEIRQHDKGMPYPVEYTYFTHQLYVVSSAPDLHDYLERIPASSPSPAPIAGASPAEKRALALAAAQPSVRSDDEADWAVLSFILLHKAKMHSLDLHRELIQICSENGEVMLAPGEVRTRRSFGHEVLLQVAVEMSLDSPGIAHRVERSPDFLRIVHDALYYPSRCWEDQVSLDLSDRARPQFERYLRDRMGWEVGQNESVPPCEQRDLLLLFEEVRKLVAAMAGGREGFLANFDRWLVERPDRASAIRDGDGAGQQARATRRTRLDQVVRDTLSGAFSEPLLEAEGVGGSWKFRWLFDASGNPCPPVATAARARRPRARGAGDGVDREARLEREAAPTPVVEPAYLSPVQDWKDHERLVLGVAQFLVDLSTDSAPSGGTPAVTGLLDFNVLSTQTGILMTSPAWPVVQRALADLAQAEREGRPFEETDASCVRDFAAMLIENGEVLAQALAWGARVGLAAGQASAGERLLIGLRVLANGLRFADLRSTQVRDGLKLLASSWPDNLSPSLVLDTDPPLLELGSAGSSWIAWVREQVAAIADPQQTAPISPDQWEVLRMASWASWLGRLKSYFDTGTVSTSPAVADLLCAAAGIGPSLLLDFRLETMTVAAWSAALFAAVAPPEKDDPVVNLAPFALRALGFEQAIWWEFIRRLFPHLAGVSPAYAASSAGSSSAGAASLRVLILRQPQGSLVDSLRPSTSCGALSLSFAQVRSRQAAARRLGEALQTGWIVAEEPIESRLVSLFSGIDSVIVPLGAKPPTVIRRGGYIVAPTTLDEIASYLRSLAAP